MKLVTKQIVFLALSSWLFCSNPIWAQSETDQFKAAKNIEEPSQRLKALQDFIDNFPESKNVGQAYRRMFRDFVKLSDEEGALNAAEKYLSTIPENRRMSPYNEISWTLAEVKMGLETAVKYAKLAEDLARAGNNVRTLRNILDTRAYVLFQAGDALTAVKLQEEAIVNNEKDAGFLGRLALYQEGAGERIMALTTISKAILYGGESTDLEHFHKWLAKENSDIAEQKILKTKIVSDVVKGYLAKSSEADQIAHRSAAAILLAKTGVDIAKATLWASAAVESINDKTAISNTIAFHNNLANVYYFQKSYQKALAAAKPVRNLVSAWDDSYWLMVGKSYQALGQDKLAVNAFLQGLTVRRPDKLMDAFTSVYTKVHGNAGGIDERIDQAKKEMEDFNPGHYLFPSSPFGRVVLAELFTGAECNPCVAADYAFDALAEYYPRTVLAILEYHVHIPGPDPLTNNDTEDRYQFYKNQFGRFGTPTAYINGNDKITGGGPKIVVQNRFRIYDYAINNYLKSKPVVHISAIMELIDGLLKLNVQVKTIDTDIMAQETAHLYIALAERSVDYEGSNGVSPHTFVVRKLIGGGKGIPMSWEKGVFKTRQTINLPSVEADLSAYLDEFAEKNPNRFRSAEGWRDRPEKLNRANLAIVVWVQDRESKKVYQSFYQDVPTDSPAN